MLAQTTPVSRAQFATLFSVVFLDNLGYAIVVPYLYFYVQYLGGSTFLYGILLAAYSLTSFVFTPIVARLSDRYGRRKILLAGLAVASFSYFIFGAANVLWVLFLGRMLSGSTAATVPVAQAYVADVTTKQQRLRYLGLLGAAAGLAFIFGPAIGGTLSTLYGYGVPSFLASALALANFVSAFLFLPEPSSFNSKRTALSFSALIAALRKRRIVLLLATYFLFFIAFVITQSALSPWLQTVFGFGSFQTGLIFFYVGGVSVFTQAALLPLLSKKLDRLAIVGVGLASFIVSMLVLAVSTNFGVLLAVVPLFAFGFGIQFVTLNTLISTNTPEEAQGGALGVAWAIAGAAQSIAPVISAGVFDFGASEGFVGLAFLASALVGLFIVPLVFAFKKQQGHSN
jgi:multidrug resistance protein